MEQIERKKKEESAGNYAFLRAYALERIQIYSGHEWTDYNLHDPGITILEALCYTLTDLAYRTRFPIADLLTESTGQISAQKNSFYSKREILSTSPTRSDDYRKIIIDEVQGVYNVWLEPVESIVKGTVRGLYEVHVQVQPAIALSWEKDSKLAKSDADRIREDIRRVITREQCLGEGIDSIVFLRPRRFSIEAKVSVHRQARYEELLSDIYSRVHNWVTPPIRFQSVAATEEYHRNDQTAFEGPLLSNGFLHGALPEKALLIDPADLMRVIGETPGVKHVETLLIRCDGLEYRHEPFRLDAGGFEFPLLVLDSPENIKLFDEHYEVPIPDAVFKSLLQKKHALSGGIGRPPAPITEELPHGTHRKLDYYHSLQRLFPAIYQLEDVSGAAGDKSAVRVARAKARQLKGYLMIFEQVLANYLAQLGNLSGIMDPDGHRAGSFRVQALTDVPGVAAMIRSFHTGPGPASEERWQDFVLDPNNRHLRLLERITLPDQTAGGKSTPGIDHLLARFNLFPDSRPVAIFERCYPDIQTARAEAPPTIVWKSELLRDVAPMTYGKYRAPQPDRSERADYDSWIRRLLFIRNDRRQSMTAVFSDIGRELPAEENADTPFELIFPDQDKTFFTNALNAGNYEIEQDATGHWASYYHAPSGRLLLGRSTDEVRAVNLIRRTRMAVRELNIRSEGFHIVEHLRLRQPRENRSYGFRILTGDNLDATNTHWVSSTEREKFLRTLLREAKENQEAFLQAAGDGLQLPFEDAGGKKPINSRALAYLDADHPQLTGLWKKCAAIGTPDDMLRIEPLVRLPDGTVLAESFFDFRVTVLLPDWPARMQDKGFRDIATRIFRENAPAHLRLDLHWLSLNEMKRFEDTYFNWNASGKPDSALRDSLTLFLHQYSED